MDHVLSFNCAGHCQFHEQPGLGVNKGSATRPMTDLPLYATRFGLTTSSD